ncbi:kynurenine/alpha-aminoadipate aminotransferase, mitochondrial isoform X2 [Lycorma delicatula]|uniref:kynurenine/alpha-aminoadipate aminotransferase, mitochondrial isoform X2 n=1 Tax=Lycorma delicatula TaxID=130591 RepID=UPI003F50F34C
MMYKYKCAYTFSRNSDLNLKKHVCHQHRLHRQMVSGKFIRKLGISAAAQQLQLTQVKKSDLSVLPQHTNLKKEIDYDYFFNAITKRRRPSMLREISYKMTQMPPSSIMFGVGIPNVNTFPFKSITVNLKDSSQFVIEGKDLEAALQYLPSKGYLPLIEKLKALQDMVHGAQDWNKRCVIVTSGAQEALCNAVEMSLNEGDSIIVPKHIYAGTVDLFRPYLPRCFEIPQDKDGLRPDVLRYQLQKARHDGVPMPKIMYTNPTGCNPTGVNLSNRHKREIYELACDFNFLILEDDPYYFLHFMEENPESFLSMDTEGRVLRFDSFSKTMSSGLRLGFVTGPNELLRKMELHVQVSTLHTSAISQVLLNKLIDQWGLERLLNNFREVQEFYRMKRDHMMAACDKHLKGLAEWNVPTGGMFLWLRINGIDDTYKLAMEECTEKCVLVVPGHPFFMQDELCSYIRLSYSLPTPEQMDEGCSHLADIIRKRLNKTK